METPIQILIKQNQTKILAIKQLVSSLFKNAKGEPLLLSDGQCLLFEAVTNPRYKWVWDSAPTRYGKTDTLAVALLYTAVFHRIKIVIVGGSMEKANKIMEYILQHVTDNPEFAKGLLNVPDISKVEKLKIMANKEALRWASGGWIFITSVDSRTKSKEGEGVVGEGGDIVVLEEAGLIKEDDQFSKIVRMPEENNGWGKLIMSGNCVERSVFEKAYNNPIYHKVRVTLDQAILEGRYPVSRMADIKAQTTPKDWKRYHLVEFPLANEFTYFKPRKYDILPPIDELDIYGSIDPALGESEKGSKTGIIVLGKHKVTGQRYELESSVKHMKPEEAIRYIFNLPYIFKRFVFEAIQFQKYFLDITKRLSMELGKDIPFEGITQAKNKLERIESLEPPILTGYILFKGGNQLWDDLGEYPKLEFPDGIDALEMAYKASETKKPSLYIDGETF